MKRLKLRKEIKILLGLIILIFIIVLDNNYVEKNIERCIHNGVDSSICEELRK